VYTDYTPYKYAVLYTHVTCMVFLACDFSVRSREMLDKASCYGPGLTREKLVSNYYYLIYVGVLLKAASMEIELLGVHSSLDWIVQYPISASNAAQRVL